MCLEGGVGRVVACAGMTQSERIYGLFQHLIYEAFFGFLVGTFATIVMAGRVSEQMKQVCPR